MTSESYKLRDKDVRELIYEIIIPQLTKTPSRVVGELSVCNGEARVDIAVINGRLHGIEIKSEADTLGRLQNQIVAYNKVFDTMTIVSGTNHLHHILATVPLWWGVYTTSRTMIGKPTLIRVRKPTENREVDGSSLAQLLWKPELLELLCNAGITKGLSNKPCRALHPLVASTYKLDDLKVRVRQILTSRENWRPDFQQM